MKNCLYTILFFSLFFTACFEDESNKEMRALNPIIIENVNLDYSMYSLYMGDTLKIEPLVYCEGVPDSKLSYKWELYGDAYPSVVIDSTMFLNAQIIAPPSPFPYTIRLTVKDETTGICRIETFRMNVLSPFGEGLIVADTKDDVDSDLSLVICRAFSTQVSRNDNKIRIFRDIWSQNNGSKLSGLVMGAMSSSFGSNRSLTIVTNRHLYRTDYYNYINIPEEQDDKLFHLAPPYIGQEYTSCIFGKISMPSTELMVLNGKVTSRNCQNNERRYDYTRYPARVSDYNITLMASPRGYPTYAYDAMGKRMIFLDYKNAWLAKDQVSYARFDVNDLSAYDGFFMGEMQYFPTLLAKETATGAYKALKMRRNKMNSTNFSASMYDFSAATEIGNAKFFSMNQREDVIYYATESKLYATPVSHINSTVQWEANTEIGEKITGIYVYNDLGGYIDHEKIGSDGKPEVETIASTNRMIMIVTYNENTKEGKVHCIPIETLGIGELEKNKNYHVELSGFGKILGVYKQIK